MGFSEDLKAETHGTQCNVAMLLDEMEGVDRDELLAALLDLRGVPSEVIERAIRRGGYAQVCGRQAIRKHRRDECVCTEMAT